MNDPNTTQKINDLYRHKSTIITILYDKEATALLRDVTIDALWDLLEKLNQLRETPTP